jgi:hypothetical protein
MGLREKSHPLFASRSWQLDVNLRPRRRLADNEMAPPQVIPPDLLTVGQFVGCLHRHIDPLGPQMSDVTTVSNGPPGKKGDIEPELADGRQMLGRAALDKIQP